MPDFVLNFSRLMILIGSIWIAVQTNADPFAEPGDTALRMDLEFLADRGLIRTPITTWPMSWAEISVAIDSVTPAAVALPGVQTTLKRLRDQVARNISWGFAQTNYEIAAIDNRSRVRTFNERPRGSIELAAEIEYTGQAFASKLRISLLNDSLDDQSIRLDGSYLGYIYNNVSFSFGAQDAWWGPGLAGSLILSSNARPTPSFTIRRNVPSPFASGWLRWIGPWTAVAFAGKLESNRFVSDPYLLGARIAAKPTRNLELGVSRTAQWGGKGRPESFESFVNLLIGRDNVGEGVERDQEPGNQLAGFDARYSLSRFGVPLTVYGQIIGEDEAGGFPSRYLGQGGVSYSLPLDYRQSTLRVNLEYSDSTCQFNESSKLFNCAYNHSLYQSGYRYRGRSIGHSTDGDSQQFALMLGINTVDRKNWLATIRSGKINRDNSADQNHSVSVTRTDFIDIDVQYSRVVAGGKIDVGIGYQGWDSVATDSNQTDVRVFARWASSYY